MNDAGLAMGWLWQSNISFHQKYNASGPPEAITMPDLSYYILGSFSTVEEVRAYLNPAQLQITTQARRCCCPRRACAAAGATRMEPQGFCLGRRQAPCLVMHEGSTAQRQQRCAGTEHLAIPCPSPPAALSPPAAQIIPAKVRKMLTTVFTSDPDQHT